MSDFYTCTERVYYYPPNGGTPIFIAGKGEQIPMEQAVRLGLVSKAPAVKKAKPEDKAIREEQIEDKAARPKRKA